jgi:hypothetical protein
MTTPEQLTKLAERVGRLDRSNNAIDVLVELAMFKPGTCYTACRANNAGTKVIFTDRAGNDITSWADDWTIAARRKATAATLLARAEQTGSHP